MNIPLLTEWDIFFKNPLQLIIPLNKNIQKIKPDNTFFEKKTFCSNYTTAMEDNLYVKTKFCHE